MSTEKPKTESMLALRDRETQQMLSKELMAEFQKLASDMGLDLRLGHMLPMGGKPYITHEGLKYLLQAEGGVGIKSCKFEWVENDWPNQFFVAKCILETSKGVYEGEGDAVGVPLSELKDIWTEIQKDKSLKSYEVRKRVEQKVKDYPIKNVTSHLAMDLAARRMAQTRAFNRAARIALTLALPTAEERYIDVPMGDDYYDGDVVQLATSEQVKKILEFAKSKKEAIVNLVLEYSNSYGKPEEWPIDVATDFLERAIAASSDARAEKKEKAPVKGKSGQTGLETN